MDVIAAVLFLFGREELRNEVRDHLYKAGPGVNSKNLFSGGEILELRLDVAEPDLACRCVNVVQRNKPCSPLLWLDHEMSYRQSAAVNDYALHIAGDLIIGSLSFAPEYERYLCQSRPLPSRQGYREPCLTSVPEWDSNRCAASRLS